MSLTRRSFFSTAGAVALGVATLALPGCGGSRAASKPSSGSSAATSAGGVSSASTSVASENAASSRSASAGAATSDALVLYFSRAGENYGVGVIEKDNTAIVAEMIAEQTDADLFEIVPVEAYPESYSECCDIALAERDSGKRPDYVGDVDLAAYSTIYLGYPIWWSDLPMCLYTFLESHDWAGKEIRPFCTHAGSGLAGTVESIQAACAGSNVGQGLAIAGTTAQESREEARSAVNAWIA